MSRMKKGGIPTPNQQPEEMSMMQQLGELRELPESGEEEMGPQIRNAPIQFSIPARSSIADVDPYQYRLRRLNRFGIT